jgi:hypothetical protein
LTVRYLKCHRFAASGNGNVIESVPLHVEFIWKLRLILLCFLLHVELESSDNLFGGRIIISQRID